MGNLFPALRSLVVLGLLAVAACGGAKVEPPDELVDLFYQLERVHSAQRVDGQSPPALFDCGGGFIEGSVEVVGSETLWRSSATDCGLPDGRTYSADVLCTVIALPEGDVTFEFSGTVIEPAGAHCQLAGKIRAVTAEAHFEVEREFAYCDVPFSNYKGEKLPLPLPQGPRQH